MPKTKATVLIVGAGPVGLLTALRLGLAGIDTLVIEAHDSILPATRAMVYMPVVIPVLTKLGIVEAVKREAYLNRDGISWRSPDGNELAYLPLADSEPGNFEGVLLFGQYRMAALLLEELKKYPSVEVRFGVKCGGIEDVPGAELVKVLVHSRELGFPDQLLEAKYVVAADGANSTVRRALCLTFDGFTYSDWKMIGSDVVYDFIEQEDFRLVNFVVHEEDWALIAYTGQDDGGGLRGSGKPVWRVTYVEPPDLPSSAKDYVERARERVPMWMKGNKKFEIVRAEPYINQQRCASQARKGRVLLAGDSLHSNNPMGGLGLTGGILDAFVYGNALVRVIKGGEDDQLLTDCANSRRGAWLSVTNQLSQANLRRMNGFDAESIKMREAFFKKLKDDPAAIRKGFDRMIPDTFEELETRVNGHL